MVLIIAEKPSLGRNIAAGLGSFQRRDGYLENENCIITWAFGHLFSLADIEAYNPTANGEKRWTMENLPCFPQSFRYELRLGEDKKLDDGVLKQFNVIKALCNRDDVDVIVNAGDADREGEIIVRTCVNKALETQKEQKRLWLPDQNPETVRAAFAEMKSETEYDNLANEGYARTYIDWLYGVNLTRLATLRTGTLLRVGRVIVPIVKAIYDRDMAILNFIPEKYYSISSKAETNGEVVELQSKLKFNKDQYNKALEACELYNSSDATVVNIKRKKDSISPSKLYSLSKLQSVLGKKYKMSMNDSLAIVQKLYEEGYLTYPRTNSEYLATAEKDKVKKILNNCAKLGYPVAFKDKKTIFDDSKIESHSAITPTYKIPDKSKLSENEMRVYSTVFRRFIAVFCAEECLAERVEMTVDVGGHETFTLKGLTIIEKGWMKYDDSTQKDKLLPSLKKGDSVNIRFEPNEKETSPPKHYTI
ncbi:MAG: DNA topoisomerase III, partial [Clostridia bacterium]|nr:DNA topoisomerase III [Clostridia bacterium]